MDPGSRTLLVMFVGLSLLVIAVGALIALR